MHVSIGKTLSLDVWDHGDDFDEIDLTCFGGADDVRVGCDRGGGGDGCHDILFSKSLISLQSMEVQATACLEQYHCSNLKLNGVSRPPEKRNAWPTICMTKPHDFPMQCRT